MAEGTQPTYRASTTAPVNIAVIKYWGKRDAKLNLPTNSSLSVTLNLNDLRTITTATCSPTYTKDSLMINHEDQDISTPRTQACLRELRALRRQIEDSDSSLPPLSTYHLRIVSSNNFPTAAGLASSAAGFAALVRAIADLYELRSTPVELSRIARQGSGSACRSLMGGYVAWDQGTASDGTDSLAREVFPSAHWPNMRALILVISAGKKDVPSTSGMQATVATSDLFSTRATSLVPKRMAQMEQAIKNKDFAAFGELCMRDSNTFHATCLDTYPPIFYLKDASHAAIRMVEAVNAAAGKLICAYTFDAGPNAVIFYEDSSAEFVESSFRSIVGGVDGWKAQFSGQGSAASTFAGNALPKVDERIATTLRGGVARVILTSVGGAPIKSESHLV